MPIQIENAGIPHEHLTGVLRALVESFGASRVDEITDLTEGISSNRAFRIVVEGQIYLLRINTRRGDVARQFSCMRMAAEAGLAPRVWYSNDHDRVSITDFVDAVSLPPGEALRSLPLALRTLHGLSEFPAATFNTTCTFLLNRGEMLDSFLDKFKAESPLPKKEIEEVLRQYARMLKIGAPFTSDVVPSHNDLFKPDNILHDGTRIWLVDWEASFPNDRYADLAVVTNMLAANDDEECAFLRAYFAAPPTPYQTGRLHLMRQVAHMFYAMAFLSDSSAEKLSVLSEPPLHYGEFQKRFWSGELRLGDERSKATFGNAHWNELLRNLREPRFQDALSAVQNADN